MTSALQKCFESREQANFILEFAFPYHQYLPADSPKSCSISTIAAFVAIKFFNPKRNARLRRARQGASGVSVPETSVHEDSPASRRENEVWATW
jgi:hypothetical protein